MMNLSRRMAACGAIRLAGASLCWISLLVTTPAQGAVDFYQDVFPILKANCVSCHNKTTTEGGLNLESPELIRKGGDSGIGVVPGTSAESLIFQASKHEGDYVMPPKNNKVSAVDLTPAELEVLAAWINGGAKDSVLTQEVIKWRPLPAGVHPIYSVATTRDGRWAACGRANQLAVYDLATQRLAEVIVDTSLPSSQTGRSHQGLVQSVVFSPDGQRLASGSFREVKIWQQSQSAVTKLPLRHVPEVIISTLSPDGTLVVSVDEQRALHVADVRTGNEIKVIPGIAATAVSALSIASDGKSAVVVSADPEIAIWELQSATRLAGLPVLSPVKLAGWTADGKSVAVAGEDKIIRIWLAPAAADQTVSAPVELTGATGNFTALTALAAPDRIAAACDDGQIHVWPGTGGTPQQSLKIAGTVALGGSRDGKLLAAGCQDGKIRIVDLKSEKTQIEIKDDGLSAARLAQANWQLATEKLELDYQKKEIARLTAENKSLDEVLKKSNETIETVNKVLPDKQKALAVATEAKQTAQVAVDDVMAKIAALAEGMKDAELDKQLQALQPNLMKVAGTVAVAQKDLRGSENHLNDATNEVAIATATQARNTELLNSANEASAAVQKQLDQVTAELASVKKSQAELNRVPMAVAFTSDAQAIAGVFNNGDQCVWAVVSGAPLVTLAGEKSTTSAMMASPSPGALTTILADGQCATLNTTSHWILERTLGGDGAPLMFADRVNALQFSPDGKVLAAGSGEPSRSGEITLWEVETGNQIAAWRDRHHDAVLCLDFSPDGKHLASGAADKLVKVTEVASGQVYRVFEGHTHHAMGVGYRADGRVLVSSGGDNALLLWDLQTGERIRKIPGWTKEVTSAHFMGATVNILTSAGDNQIRVVNDQGTQIRSIPNLPEFMHSSASPADGQWIVAGGEDGVLRVWSSADGKEMATFGTP